MGLQPTDFDPWGRPGIYCAIDTGWSLSSGRANRGPVGRCDEMGDTTADTGMRAVPRAICGHDRTLFHSTPLTTPLIRLPS
jgi:hypothetical protein